MGGAAMEDDGEREEQRVKRAAAAEYDYEGDPRWADYWSNVLLPPHMASRSDVVDHYKRKFYQRYIDPDLVVEPMSSTSSTTSGRISANKLSSESASEDARSTSGSCSQSASESLRPHNSGPGTRTSSSTGRNGNSSRMDRRSIHFSVNALVLVVTVLGMLPVLPRNLSSKAYQLSLLGTTCSSFYSLHTLYGKPRAWNLLAVQSWLQSIIGTNDFIHLIYCLTFLTSKLHLKFALIPLLFWALDHIARFLRRNFTHSSIYRRYLEKPCVWVEANGTTLGILTSHAQVGLGFLLILSLFSWQRNIIHTFMYWQLLKLMYHAPVTSSYHQSVWAQIGRDVNPYVDRYAPFLNSPISMVKRWWYR